MRVNPTSIVPAIADLDVDWVSLHLAQLIPPQRTLQSTAVTLLVAPVPISGSHVLKVPHHGGSMKVGRASSKRHAEKNNGGMSGADMYRLTLFFDDQSRQSVVFKTVDFATLRIPIVGNRKLKSLMTGGWFFRRLVLKPILSRLVMGKARAERFGDAIEQLVTMEAKLVDVLGHAVLVRLPFPVIHLALYDRQESTNKECPRRSPARNGSCA